MDTLPATRRQGEPEIPVLAFGDLDAVADAVHRSQRRGSHIQNHAERIRAASRRVK
jgi:hypothetical protein